MEKERVENFRYQQRAKELEKAVTPFLKVRFQNVLEAPIGHLLIHRHLIGREHFFEIKKHDMDNDSDMILPYDGEFQKAKSIGNVADGEGRGSTHRLVSQRYQIIWSLDRLDLVLRSLVKAIFFEVGIKRLLKLTRKKNSQKIFLRIRLPKHQIKILKFENQF